jgi:hypothetical protein
LRNITVFSSAFLNQDREQSFGLKFLFGIRMAPKDSRRQGIGDRVKRTA